ncbi:hypothetical protein BD410DRAFT_292019 [Rickenella mellea]|uniref:Uncharacterized protein n=1 Tax=Rickenella mellea TaxID=50990 RepID=A0A4Y7Q1D5_9AGAM|nr:hypothetical protein BD410DRAFT_292019 [Rickenella mellea]
MSSANPIGLHEQQDVHEAVGKVDDLFLPDVGKKPELVRWREDITLFSWDKRLRENTTSLLPPIRTSRSPAEIVSQPYSILTRSHPQALGLEAEDATRTIPYSTLILWMHESQMPGLLSSSYH